MGGTSSPAAAAGRVAETLAPRRAANVATKGNPDTNTRLPRAPRARAIPSLAAAAAGRSSAERAAPAAATFAWAQATSVVRTWGTTSCAAMGTSVVATPAQLLAASVAGPAV